MVETLLVAILVLLVLAHFRITSLQTDVQLLRAERLKGAPLTLDEEADVATGVTSPLELSRQPEKR